MAAQLFNEFEPLTPGEIMEPAPPGMPLFPDDLLLVEDDPIIALGFEDTILGLGVKIVRTAGSVAKALAMIADRAPDFALLDVGLIREKSFAIAERLDALTDSVRLRDRIRRRNEGARGVFGPAATAETVLHRSAGSGTAAGRRRGMSSLSVMAGTSPA